MSTVALRRRAVGLVAPGASPPLTLAALLAVYVIWGSTYLGIRLAIDTIPPLLMSGVRFMVAGLLMCAWALRPVRKRSTPAAGRERPRLPSLAQCRATLVVGTALVAVGNGGVTLAEQAVPSGVVALLIATVPLWMAFLANCFLGERLRPLAWLGIAVGLGGVALLLRPGGGGNRAAMLAVLVSPLCWAAGSLYARRADLPRSTILSTGMEMLFGGAVLLAVGLIRGEAGRVHLGAFSNASLLAFVYLVLIGSIIGYSSYVFILTALPTAVVATYAYVNPLVAVALGAVFLSEVVRGQTLVAGGLIVVAVALILAQPVRSHRPDHLPDRLPDHLPDERAAA